MNANQPPLRSKLIAVVLLLLVCLAAGVRPAAAQSLAASHQYSFGSVITFRAELPAGSQVELALLFVQMEGAVDTGEFPVKPGPDGALVYRFDVAVQPVRAFSTLTYWFEVQLADGSQLKSEPASFQYEDNRFNWETREARPFRVHWYEGEADFAQNILDVVQAGLNRIQGLLPAQAPEWVDIYAYGTAAEMQATLDLASQDWVAAGHADPDLGVIVVTLPAGPDQRVLMEQRLPHELTHILLYQKLGAGYTRVPTWLSEGLASNAELYPNPDYLVLLNNAHEKDSLLPIASLCKTFPRDASSALLAYAQSASFTRFIHQQYGTAGLERLLGQYLDGIECERGPELALDGDLAALERAWRRETFGESALLAALKKMLPWLALLVAALAAPLGLAVGSLRRRPAKPGERFASGTRRLR